MKHIPGRCPKCNSENIEYGNSEHYDNSVGYQFQCLDCKFQGEEIANLTFACFLDEDGNEVPED